MWDTRWVYFRRSGLAGESAIASVDDIACLRQIGGLEEVNRNTARCLTPIIFKYTKRVYTSFPEPR